MHLLERDTKLILLIIIYINIHLAYSVERKVSLPVLFLSWTKLIRWITNSHNNISNNTTRIKKIHVARRFQFSRSRVLQKQSIDPSFHPIFSQSLTDACRFNRLTANVNKRPRRRPQTDRQKSRHLSVPPLWTVYERREGARTWGALNISRSTQYVA